MFSQMTLILEVCYEGKKKDLKAQAQKPLCFSVYWNTKYQL